MGRISGIYVTTNSVCRRCVVLTLHNILVYITRAICTCVSDSRCFFWAAIHFSIWDFLIAILLLILRLYCFT